MIKVMAKYMAFMLLVSGLVTASYAVPAVAHTGLCTPTGNTWRSGNTLYGSGNVDCSVVHDKMYIQVTLEVREDNGWISLRGTTAEKTRYDVPSIYKQTSYTCQVAGGSGWGMVYRVRIFYKVWNNGQLNHSDTVWKGQDTLPCAP